MLRNGDVARVKVFEPKLAALRLKLQEFDSSGTISVGPNLRSTLLP
jgi:hypothetical protein